MAAFGNIEHKRPKDEQEFEKLSNALYNLLESIRIIAILIKPFMPDASQKITEQLGTAEEKISDCIFKEFNGTPKRGSYLFTKIKIT